MVRRKPGGRIPSKKIKRIMQADEEVGRINAAVPVMMSRAIELFLASLLHGVCQHVRRAGSGMMRTCHIRRCVEEQDQFDFLREIAQRSREIAQSGGGRGRGGGRDIKQHHQHKRKHDDSAEVEEEEGESPRKRLRCSHFLAEVDLNKEPHLIEDDKEEKEEAGKHDNIPSCSVRERRKQEESLQLEHVQNNAAAAVTVEAELHCDSNDYVAEEKGDVEVSAAETPDESHAVKSPAMPFYYDDNNYDEPDGDD